MGIAPGQGCGVDEGKAADREWISPLCHLVKDVMIKSPGEIDLYFLPAKEFKSSFFFFPLGATLKNEIVKISLVKIQAWTGQWTRFRASSPRATSVRLLLLLSSVRR